jgi:hypothetical protein
MGAIISSIIVGMEDTSEEMMKRVIIKLIFLDCLLNNI